jgi:hypothetical protein
VLEAGTGTVKRTTAIWMTGALLALGPQPAFPLQVRGEISGEHPGPVIWSPAERAALDLLRSLRAKERPADDVLASQLAEAGESLLPLLFQVLAQRSVPAHDGSESQKLSEIQEHVILLAIGLFDRERTIAHVSSELLRSREPAVRAAALGCLGAVGRANDLPALFELALAAEEQALAPRLEAGLRRAVASILARDPRAFAQLLALRRVTRPELVRTLLCAVGDSRDGRGLEYLSEVAYWNEDLVLDVMTQVRQVGPCGDETINTGLKNRLRPYLDADQPGHCRAAILALTALRDFEAIGPLIELLACDCQGIREGALWSLRTLTGLGLSTRESWARWHQSESAWLLREKGPAFRRLRSNDAAQAAEALRAILPHPLARDELCAALPDLLRNRWPAVRVLACRSLADLAAKDAVPKLVWALEDPAPEVASAAHEALRTLTGLDLPRDPAAWQASTNVTASTAEP